MLCLIWRKNKELFHNPGYVADLKAVHEFEDIVPYLLSQLQSCCSGEAEVISQGNFQDILGDFTDCLVRRVRIAGRKLGRLARDSSESAKPYTSQLQVV